MNDNLESPGFSKRLQDLFRVLKNQQKQFITLQFNFKRIEIMKFFDGQAAKEI